MGTGTREIVVRAHTWGFSPRVVRVRPGETVRFVASSEDMRHGFAIGPLGVNLALHPGREVRSAEVGVTLPEGIYTIHCSVFCGLGHPSMKAKLVVGVPPPAPGGAMPWIASLAVSVLVAAFAIGTFAGRRG
jgi:cytochrome c oxidase subunit II